MSFEGPREVTDPKAMRALAHPLRIALLELLAEGPLTATEAGERLGESPANASFHLRQLAKYGFVEEAPGATGRRRPWKVKQLGMRFTDVHDDEATASAARLLDRTLRERYLRRLEQGMEDRQSLPEQWRAVTGASQFLLYVTPAELRELDEEITHMLRTRFGERRDGTAPRPPDARRVEWLAFSYVRPEP
jgi:DNA-binding transcriptional ArsR family regulator